MKFASPAGLSHRLTPASRYGGGKDPAGILVKSVGHPTVMVAHLIRQCGNETPCRWETENGICNCVRTLCKDPALPFFTVQINKATDGRTTDVHCGMMREAQRQAAHRIPRVFVVPAHDLPMSDAVHNNTAANGVIGERLAWSALEGVYGKPYFGKAPDAIVAKREQNSEAMRIRVTFAHVVMGLVDFGCTAPLCRLRTDCGSELPIHRAICKGSELILDTDPYEGTLYFDFAADSLPAVPVSPIDRGTGMPPLGVYGLPVA